jgi:predicted GIY-YIG superfamily endonuclease
MSAYLYILRCADGSDYVGTTRSGLEVRIAEHQAGTFDGYTVRRRPLALVFHQEFERIEDAVAVDREVKGWRREKKEALIRGDFAALPELSRRAARHLCVLRHAPRLCRVAPQHEDISLMALRKCLILRHLRMRGFLARRQLASLMLRSAR